MPGLRAGFRLSAHCVLQIDGCTGSRAARWCELLELVKGAHRIADDQDVEPDRPGGLVVICHCATPFRWMQAIAAKIAVSSCDAVWGVLDR